ncbi:MAG TPA: NAD-dependent epimerase/dehydratase family protein [Solirubrobacterales bacterium]|nr:NAD-dependent epimerase/dehydratase family protein [Solirubrobacterales bacterium]
MQGSKILVIGCGFIGSNIVEELAGLSHRPRVLTRSRPPVPLAKLVREEDLMLGDAQEREVLGRALQGVDHVIFSAGGLLPAASEENPELDAELTLGPVQSVLGALRSRQEVSLTYLSSGGTVYGEPSDVPVPEDAPTHPAGAYGRLHLACEEAVLAHSREHGTRVRILRCSSVYGRHQYPDRGQGALVTFLNRIETGRSIDLYGGGESIRDYVYANDVAKAVVRLLETSGGEQVVNVGSGQGTRLIDLLRLAEREAGRQAEIVQHPPREFEVGRIVLDIDRLQRLIDFEPTSLQDGVAMTRRWLRSEAPARV